MRNLIKLILEDEVNRKYDKPTPKIEQLVYRWLNDYFDGAKMYHDKSWETRHDIEWCNYGKEIISLILFFEDINGGEAPGIAESFYVRWYLKGIQDLLTPDYLILSWKKMTESIKRQWKNFRFSSFFGKTA